MEQNNIIRFEDEDGKPQTQNKVWCKVETITPQIAQEYLAMNINNRKIREAKVHEYADAILRGQWQLNGEAISFDVKGHLANGQHRLLAIIEAGKQNPNIAIQTVVVRNVSEESFLTYDSGAGRKLQDAFHFAGITDANNIAAIINKVLQWRKGGNAHTLNRRDRASMCVTKQDCIEEYNKNAEYYTKINKYCASWYNESRLLKRSEMGALFIYLNIDKGYAEDVVYNFFNALLSVNGNKVGTIGILYKKLYQDKITKAKLPAMYKYAIIAKTWNAYTQGKELKVLAWNEQKEGKIDFI